MQDRFAWSVWVKQFGLRLQFKTLVSAKDEVTHCVHVRRCTSVFWHVARLDDDTPANMALHPHAWIENSVPERLKFSKIHEF